MARTYTKGPKPESSTPSDETPLDKSTTNLEPVELYKIYSASGKTILEMVVSALRGDAQVDKGQAYEIMDLLGMAHMEKLMLSPTVPITEKVRWWFQHRSLTEGSKVALTDTRQPQSQEVVQARIAAANKRLEDLARKYVTGKATDEQMATVLLDRPVDGETN